MSRFPDFIERVLGHEGRFTANPKDPGNWTGGRVGVGTLKGTNWGIAANSYPNIDIAHLTRAEAIAIYERDFWDAVRGDDLPPMLAFQALDVAVNHGPSRARRMLQLAAGVLDDGIIGPITLAALRAADRNDLTFRFLAERLDFYTSLPTWGAFGKGWTRRVAGNLRFAALDN